MAFLITQLTFWKSWWIFNLKMKQQIISDSFITLTDIHQRYVVLASMRQPLLCSFHSGDSVALYVQVFKFLVFPQLNFLSNKLCRAKSPWKVKRSARGHLRSLMSMRNEQKAQKCVCVKTGPNKLRRKLLNWLHHMSATVQIVAKPHRLNSRGAAYFANKVITECKVYL